MYASVALEQKENTFSLFSASITINLYNNERNQTWKSNSSFILKGHDLQLLCDKKIFQQAC